MFCHNLEVTSKPQAWYADGGDGREGHLPLRCPDWRPVSGEPETKIIEKLVLISQKIKA